MMQWIIILLSGFLFGSGLTISGMINPNKVMGFLDFTGAWDPTLAFVMFSALIVTFIGYRYVFRRRAPVFCDQFHLPQTTQIDAALIIGAATFGTGWGLAGYCPGPAITALGLRIADAGYFIVGMLISTFLFKLLSIFNNRKK